jgi:hypothetical protein
MSSSAYPVFCVGPAIAGYDCDESLEVHHGVGESMLFAIPFHYRTCVSAFICKNSIELFTSRVCDTKWADFIDHASFPVRFWQDRRSEPPASLKLRLDIYLQGPATDQPNCLADVVKEPGRTGFGGSG